MSGDPRLFTLQTSLPDSYARFNNLDTLIARIPRFRETIFFNEASELVWNILCMSFDRIRQRGLYQELIDTLRSVPVSEHEGAIRSYWENLARTSSYTLYVQEAESLTKDGFAYAQVRSWKKGTQAFRGQSDRDTMLDYAASVYPYVYDLGLSDEALGAENRRSTHANARFLFLYVQGSVPAVYRPYLFALIITEAARKLFYKKLLEQIDQLTLAFKGSIRIQIPDLRLKIQILLRRTEPYRVISRELIRKIWEEEEKLFGQNAPLSGALWRVVVFLRTSVLPKDMSHIRVRACLLEMLLKGEFDQARYYVEDLMAKYPGILPSFIKEQLTIEPDVLRDLYVEEAQKTTRDREPSLVASKRLIDRLVGKTVSSPDGRSSVRLLGHSIKPLGGTSSVRVSLRVYVSSDILAAYGVQEMNFVSYRFLQTLMKQFHLTEVKT